MIVRLAVVLALLLILRRLSDRAVKTARRRPHPPAYVLVWSITYQILFGLLLAYALVGVWDGRLILIASSVGAMAAYLLHVTWRASHPNARSWPFEVSRVVGELGAESPKRVAVQAGFVGLLLWASWLFLVGGLLTYARGSEQPDRVVAVLNLLIVYHSLILVIVATAGVPLLVRWTLDDDTRSYLLMRLAAASVPVYVFAILLAVHQQAIPGLRLRLLEAPVPVEPRINVVVLASIVLLIGIIPFLHGVHSRRNETLRASGFEKDRLLTQLKLLEGGDRAHLVTALTHEVERLNSESRRVRAHLRMPHEWLKAPLAGAALRGEGLNSGGGEPRDIAEGAVGDLRQWLSGLRTSAPSPGRMHTRPFRLRAWEIRCVVFRYGDRLADTLERTTDDPSFLELVDSARLIYELRESWVPVRDWNLRVAELRRFARLFRETFTVDLADLAEVRVRRTEFHRPARWTGCYIMKVVSSWNRALATSERLTEDMLDYVEDLPFREPSWGHATWLDENRTAVSGLLEIARDKSTESSRTQMKQQWDYLKEAYKRATDDEARHRAQKTVLARPILPLAVPVGMAVVVPLIQELLRLR